eukprot:2001661-Prymnesium_polylepis.1
MSALRTSVFFTLGHQSARPRFGSTVDEKREEPHARERVRVGVLVVVHLVELARLVLENLEELRVVLGHPRRVDHALVHAVDQRVVDARRHLAPRLLRRAHGRDDVARERAVEVAARRREERLRLLRRDEVVKGDDVRVGAVHRRLEARQRERALEGAVDVALGFGGAVVPLVAVRVPPAARRARARAALPHEAGVGVAFAALRPQVAVGVIVLVGTVGIDDGGRQRTQRRLRQQQQADERRVRRDEAAASNRGGHHFEFEVPSLRGAS